MSVFFLDICLKVFFTQFKSCVFVCSMVFGFAQIGPKGSDIAYFSVWVGLCLVGVFYLFIFIYLILVLIIQYDVTTM